MKVEKARGTVKNEWRRILSRRGWMLPGFFVVALIATACAAPQADRSAALPSTEAQDEFGVKPISIRLTAEDFFIDFRFQVTDPEKAREILRRSSRAYLVDIDSGKMLPVPITKLGPLRGVSEHPKPGRVYAVLFSNVDKVVEKGSRVTVVLGDFQRENLIVE